MAYPAPYLRKMLQCVGDETDEFQRTLRPQRDGRTALGACTWPSEIRNKKEA